MAIFLALRSRPFEDFETGAQHALFAGAQKDHGMKVAPIGTRGFHKGQNTPGDMFRYSALRSSRVSLETTKRGLPLHMNQAILRLWRAGILPPVPNDFSTCSGCTRALRNACLLRYYRDFKTTSRADGRALEVYENRYHRRRGFHRFVSLTDRKSTRLNSSHRCIS